MNSYATDRSGKRKPGRMHVRSPKDDGGPGTATSLKAQPDGQALGLGIPVS